LKVRFDFDNAKMLLKPAMYVDVTLQINAGESVVVPESAVMDTDCARSSLSSKPRIN